MPTTREERREKVGLQWREGIQGEIRILFTRILGDIPFDQDTSHRTGLDASRWLWARFSTSINNNALYRKAIVLSLSQLSCAPQHEITILRMLVARIQALPYRRTRGRNRRMEVSDMAIDKDSRRHQEVRGVRASNTVAVSYGERLSAGLPLRVCVHISGLLLLLYPDADAF